MVARQQVCRVLAHLGLPAVLTVGILGALYGVLQAPPVVQAEMLITDCSTHLPLQAALNVGGQITFQCGSPLLELSAPLTATKHATIDGFNGGNPIVLHSLGGTRIISVSGNVVLTLSNLTLRNGNALDGHGGGAVRVAGGSSLVAVNTVFRDNRATAGSTPRGGAVYGLPGSTVVISGSQVLSNTAAGGGGILADVALLFGSQLVSNTATENAGGMGALTATVVGSSIVGNTAANDVGGIGARLATISGTRFLSNTAERIAGGLYAFAGATVTNSEFTNNRVLTTASAFGNGGGIYSGGTLEVAGSTFLSNTVRQEGGGAFASSAMTVTASYFFNNSAYDGGGFATNGAANVSGSSFVSNTATDDGGGFRANSAAIVSNSSFLSNTAHDGGGFRGFSVATVSGSSFLSNTATDDGGGFATSGAITVSGSSFLSNTAHDGGGFRTDGPATVSGSSFVSNTASDDGGGFATSGAITVSSSSFLSNLAGGGGGFLGFGSATVSGSSFVSNTAHYGGGFRANGAATVSGSSFFSNTALSDGGGFAASGATVTGSSFMSNTATTNGGGIAAWSADLTNVTLAQNQAGTLGGGVAFEITLTLTNTTVANNSAPALAGTVPTKTLRLGETILTGPLPLCRNLTTTFVGNNLNRDPATCGNGGLNPDPLLGPVQDNGGGTLTMALLPGSPAIDTTNPCMTLVDQRGLTRVAPCDIGAYEAGIAPAISSLSPSSATALDPTFTLTVTGTGFISGTVALWNGSPRATTVLNSTTLSVSVPASDLLASGTAQVQARYGLAPDGTSNALPFTISKRGQTITFAPLADKTVNDPPVALSASASSGLAVSFAAGPAGVCAVAGTALSLLGPGSCTVTASQPGDSAYLAAAPVERAFTIAPGRVFLGFATKGYAGGW